MRHLNRLGVGLMRQNRASVSRFDALHESRPIVIFSLALSTIPTLKLVSPDFEAVAGIPGPVIL